MSAPLATAQDLARALPEAPLDAAVTIRALVDERPIDYALGSGEADEAGLFAGTKPLLRQLLRAEDMDRVRSRFEALGLTVVDATHVESEGSPTGPERLLFIARDARRARAAAALEAREDHDLEMGLLLGYPRCCIEAYLAVPPPRRNTDVIAAAYARTVARGGAFSPRLNTLDLAIFHYTSWLPCAFDCAPSLVYANTVAFQIARRHGQFVGSDRKEPPPSACPPGCRHQRFVARIDEALHAHRLLLVEDVQLSLVGRVEGDTVIVERAWPTARDRFPGAELGPGARDAVTRLLALVIPGRRVCVRDHSLYIDGARGVETLDALLVPFGAK